ncbi:MAG: single-stranded DNA-binding protein [Chitinivibrionales bacterium]|nr:single-stranded DNA-binding protein [Chitinivibrionales bacterium]
MIAETTDRMAERLSRITFHAPATHVYNPLIYARGPYEDYLQRYAAGRKEAVFIGMNPGPWGMVQNGIPFGDTPSVRDWLHITGTVGKPARPHPKRPVVGFACDRREVSGKRLWGWARQRYGTPERFFKRFFVANYCPLAFFAKDGTNITPDKLRKADREALFEVCDQGLRETIEQLHPRYIIGIGTFSESRAKVVAAELGNDVVVGRISHPSPANPKANRGWAQLIEGELAELGLRL